MTGRQSVYDNRQKNCSNVFTTIHQTKQITKNYKNRQSTGCNGPSLTTVLKRKSVLQIYRKQYINTPTGYVDPGVRTSKEILLPNFKAGQPFGKALDLALGVMRTTPKI